MNNSKYRHPKPVLRYFLAASMVTLMTSVASAEDALLPETVVTATRLETPSEQLGSTVSVITSQQLEDQQTPIVSEALRQVPGLAVNRSGPLGSLTQVRIRGANPKNTLVLIDGIEANDPAFESTFDFANLLTADVERIEILRGPQSALWGSDAIGGVINVITKRGSGPATVMGSGELGSFSTGQLSASVGGGSERYNYFLGGTRLLTAGVSTAPNGSERDGYDNTTWSLKAGAAPLDNLSFNLVGRYTSATVSTDTQDFSFPPGPTFGRLIDSNDYTDSRQFYGLAQARLTLLEGAWEHILSSALTDTGNDFFSDGLKTNKTDGRKLKYDYQTNYYFDTPSFASASHALLFLLEREKEEFVQRGSTPDAPQNQNQDKVSTSYAGEYDLSLWNRLFITSALRYDNNDLFADATTYRFTAAYLHPDKQTRWHTSYGTGVRNPSFIQLFGFFPRSFVGNPDLEPEKSKGWDIGVEQPLWNRRLTFDLTYFHNDFADEIIPSFDPVKGLPSVTNSTGSGRGQGIELSLLATLRKNLSLAGAYTYTWSEDSDAKEALRTPRNIASLTVNYLFLDNRAQLNLGVDYTGKQQDLDFATFPTSRVTLDGYTLVRLSGAYRVNQRLQLFGRIENLLDADYQEVFGYNHLGRAFYAGLRLSL
jgi:vitamin B12 transporter